MSHRADRFLVAVIGLICLGAQAWGGPVADPPNVVLIVADDLGWADLGCQGSRYHLTPNLDRLAARGKRFTQAYAACPVCSPTRASLMTGKHPARLGITDWLPGRPDRPDQKLLRPTLRQELPLAETTLAESLRSVGYKTAHVGKWHLGGAGFGPREQGFDVNIGGDEAGTPRSYIAPFARGGVSMPGLESAPAGQYLTDRLTEEAIRFLDASRGGRFFLYMPHYAVHTPMVAPAEDVARFKAWDGTPHGRQENPIYAAMLARLDASVGRILDWLDANGQKERTLVVFTSDNGGLATREGPNTPATNNAPLREGKGYVYEGGIRVPLLVSWPGRIEPGVEATPVWSPDLPTTIRSLAGAPAINPCDGADLSGLLTKGEPIASRDLHWHYPHYSNQGGRPSGAIRSGDWKLIEFHENGRRELFDMKRDFRESNNLAVDRPDVVSELAAKLDAWRKSVGAGMPAPNPKYAPNAQAEDGTITLPARTAEVHGVMLRYEPLPHKNTLGFWVKVDDWASWEFEVRKPGRYVVEALVGCGNGSGGSTVEFRSGGEVLTLVVEQAGGFQNFVPRKLGVLTLGDPGRKRLEARPTKKPGLAVMDLREVKLVPAESE